MNLSFSIAPYFDDFDDKKGFLKILFQPRFAVQTREVNQLQSILQNQIKKFADSIYKHGSPVVDGQTGYDLNSKWVRIDQIDTSIEFTKDYFTAFFGKEITGSNTGVKAIITDFDNSDNVNRLFIKYTSSGKNSEETFEQSEILEVRNELEIAQYQIGRVSLEDNFKGTGSRAYIKDGWYYIDGLFVNVYAQSIILSLTDSKPSVKVGLQVKEEIITVSEDSSLYDNAAGTTNFTAPGADRYKVSLELVSKPLDEVTSDKFVELLRLEKGNPTKWIKYSQYSTLGDTLARRTYDESGNYTVNGLGMTVTEHLDTGDNNGVYTEDEGGDSDKFVVRVAPGKAYIRGYEIEKYGTTDITFDKARTAVYENNSNVVADWSNYILCSDITCLPNIKSDITIFFLSGTDTSNYQNNIIGWAKIRGIDREYGSGSDIVYRLYVYDQNIMSGKTINQTSVLYSPGSYGFKANFIVKYNVNNVNNAFSEGESITNQKNQKIVVKFWDENSNILYATKSPDNDFIISTDYITGETSGASGIISGITSLQGTQNTSSLFKLPYNDISTIKSSDGTSDTTYTVTKIFDDILLDSSGVATINTEGTDTFTGSNIFVSVISEHKTFENNAELVSASSVQINLGSSYATKTVRVIADVQRNGATEKRKQYRTATKIIENTKNQKVFSIGKSNIYKVTGVWVSDSIDTTPNPDTDKNVVNNIVIDDGQRETCYKNATITFPYRPDGQIRIDYSYFDIAGTGSSDFTSIDSYSTLLIGDKSYIESTPEFSRTTGTVNLRNYIDFRPVISDNTSIHGISQQAESGSNVIYINSEKYACNDISVGTTVSGLGIPSGTTVQTIDESDPTKITLSKPVTTIIPKNTELLFGLATTRDGLTAYGTTAVSKSYIVKSNSPIRMDYYHYVGRYDVLSLKEDGEFQIQKGVPSINPKIPAEPDGAMALAYINIPAYTYSASDVKINLIDQQRYTMKDIGNLERRIETLEYVSTLNALETELNNVKITDSQTGLDRLKTGLIADNFSSNQMADATNGDISYSLDIAAKKIYPQAVVRTVGLKQNKNESSNFARTNGKLTLPFEEVSYIENQYASKSVNINTFMYANWVGEMTLTPNQDFWVDEKYLPEINVSYYDPTQNFTETVNLGSRDVWAVFGTHIWGSVRQVTNDILSRTTETVPVNYYTETNVVGTEIVPYIRSKRIEIKGTGLKPNTKVYPYFDGKDVSSYCTIDGETYNPDIIVGEDGSLKFYFDIPEETFKTGEREFKVSSQPRYVDNPEGASTYGVGYYTANGTLETKQNVNTTITATKTTQQSIVTYWYESDPLAQSFYIPDEAGCMISSIDLYFQSKHSSIPVSVEIRDMINGYPGPNIVKGGKVVVYPENINVSENSSVATNVKFEYPVYLEGGKEYCVVLLTDCPDYNVWCSELGGYDLIQSAKIDKQPVLGSLFKSQNNKTWTADQNSDLKYTLYRAKFDTSVKSIISFYNEDIPEISLINNAFTFTENSNVVKVKCLNHNMFDTNSSFVKLTVPTGTYCGVPSESLNGEFLANALDNTTFEITLDAKATESGTPVMYDAKALINYGFDSFVPNVEYMMYQGTNVKWSITPVSGKTINDNTRVPYSFQNEIDITYNRLKRIYLTDTMIVASPLNEDKQLSGNKSLKLSAILESENDFVSPILYCNDYGPDAEMVLYDNIINNPTEVTNETFLNAESSSNNFNFVTIPVNLQMQATMIKVYVEANVPSSANLRVFYRKTNGSDSELGLLDWIEIPQPNPFANSNMFDTPVDYEFSADNISAFSTFQIKISGSASNKANVPIINNYRIIALA
nr:MAG TPA: protein of unknown function (DUF4815) [Caudoviricetes sp.]